MSIYAQQINNMVESMPETEQRFIVELIRKISVNQSSNAAEITEEKRNPQAAVKRFIENIAAITDEPLDEEFDEIIKMGITLRTPEELDL